MKRNGLEYLLEVARPFRSRVALAYFLLLLEALTITAQPWAWGVAIDAAIDRQPWGFAFLAGQHGFFTATGFLRNRYDTRVFARLSAAVAVAVVAQLRALRIPSSVVAARVGLSEDLVDFAEGTLPRLLRSGLNVSAGLVALAVLEPRLILPLVGLAVPVTLFNFSYARVSAHIAQRSHNRAEREVAVVSEGSPQAVLRHFRAAAGWEIRASDASANNFLRTEFFVILLAVGAVWIVAEPGISTGSVYAVLGYLWMVVGGLDVVPNAVEAVASLRDILARLRGEEPLVAANLST